MTDPQDIDVCAHCGTPINCDESCQRGQAQLLKQYEEAIRRAEDEEIDRMADDLFTSFTDMQKKAQNYRR
jgi:glutamate dehydrogenase/leucine dehydrogenase